MPASPVSPPVLTPALLAVPRSAVALVLDLDDARRLAAELEPAATPAELEARASEILAGQLLVIRREQPVPLDMPSPQQAPRLGSLMETQ